MIEGFDKEMDILLRQTAKSENVSAAEANPQSEIPNPKFVHLDADEISAFAENALPETARRKYTAHFADCDRCRKILSNLILTHSETETIPAVSVAPEIGKTVKPQWYRRFFAFPKPAFALGALIVLLGGFLAFSVLQNTGDVQNTQVSQISESQPGASGPNFSGEPNFSANTMANTSNAAVTTNSNMTMSNSATAVPVATPVSAATDTATRASNANTTANAAPAKKETTGNEVKSETEENSTKNVPASQSADAATVMATDGLNLNERKAAELPQDADKMRVAQAPPTASLAKPSAPTENDKKDAARAKSRKTETAGAAARQIGDKNFTRKDGVWYDSNYNGQNTTNVRRGSNEYKNLDSGLRSIAESLSGTIVVIWKTKAYRIQ